MTEDLRQQLLKAVNYRSPGPTCYNCQHFKEIDNPQLDRDWIPTCDQFGKAGLVAVHKLGVCDSFTERTA